MHSGFSLPSAMKTFASIRKACALLGFVVLASTAVVAAKEGDTAAGLLNDAALTRALAISKADRDYRDAVASTLKFADRVEVYLLGAKESARTDLFSGSEDQAADLFPIRPYDSNARILKRLTVPKEDIPQWTDAVAKILTSRRSTAMAMCHNPIHGIRLFAGDLLLFETSVCWECHNYYFRYEEGAQWENLTEDATDLRALFTKFLPIPDSRKMESPAILPQNK